MFAISTTTRIAGNDTRSEGNSDAPSGRAPRGTIDPDLAPFLKLANLDFSRKSDTLLTITCTSTHTLPNAGKVHENFDFLCPMGSNVPPAT